MPLVDHKGLDFTLYDPAPADTPEPTAGEVWDSAWHLESDVQAIFDLSTRPTFKAQEGFNLGAAIKDRGVWDDRMNFVGVESQDELDFRIGRLQKERQRRETLEQAGWAGIGAAVTMGLASPTMLIPLTAGGRGIKAIKEGAALGLLAGAGQEMPLHIAQEERTVGETAVGIGASAIAGGILGGAASLLSRRELDDVISELEQDMADQPRMITIPASGGSAAVRIDPRGIKKGRVTKYPIDVLTRLSPVARVIDQQESPHGRWLMSQLSDGGIANEAAVRGETAAVGGTVENNVKTWYSNYWRATTMIDDLFSRMQFGEGGPTVARALRADIGAKMSGKMSRQQFRKEIARAMFNGDEHEITEIREAAQFIRKELWDPLYKDAVEVGIFNGNETALGDPSHMLRMFNRRMIEARKTEFIDTLAKNYEKKLVDDFTSQRENFLETERKAQEYIEDVRRPREEVDQLRAQFSEELEALEEGRGAETVELDGENVPLDEFEDTIREVRRQARQAKQAGDKDKRNRLLQDARDMERAGGETLQNLRKSRSELRRRLRNLTRAEVMLEERHAKKLRQIENLEEQNIRTLRSVIRKGQQVQRQMDRWSDKKLDQEISQLRSRFEQAARTYDRGEERITKLAQSEDSPEFDSILRTSEVQEERAGRLTDIANAIGELEDFDRAFVRSAIDEALDETLKSMNGILARRTMRTERLMKQAEKLDPETINQHIARRMEKLAAREETMSERFRLRGSDQIDLRAGEADFSAHAREMAEETTSKILGTYLRLPAVDILQTERGSELARVLDIPTNEIWDFVEQDVETLIRAHMRTMAPDVEIMRKLRPMGVNNFDWRHIIQPVVDEENAAVRRIDEAVDGKGNPRSEQWKQKQRMKVADQFSGIRRDLEATISRLRHTWGLPVEPDAMSTRVARVAMNLNTLRLMGSVTISSFPDVARPVMKYGAMRVFRDGWLPMIQNFKDFKLSAREVKLAGGALDPVLHTRAAALFDALDDVGRYSKFERGMEWATNRMGIMGLFDYWTSGMKQMSGVVANAEILDDIRVVIEGAGQREVQRATESLANKGIDGRLAQGIWEQVTRANGGGAKVNGIWLPNTESWTDPEMVKAFRSALIREVDNTIITPGVERPLFTNKNLPGRLATQFQSFMYSSTQKTVVAGLQENDARAVVGSAMSLAMGAVSYYIWALSVGGDAWKEANEFDPAKYADEAIARSGLLGIGDLGQRLLERIPATAPYATFSGERTSRRQGVDLPGTLLGPSVDLLENMGGALMGLDQPTQSAAYDARRLLPTQNIFYMRQLYDQIIDAADLPESRQ